MSTTECMIEALQEFRHDPNGISNDQFWKIVERYRATLVTQALPILGNLSDAEDVAQETLCTVFLKLDKLRDPNKLGRWLRHINRCHALQVCRRHSRKKEERLSTGQADSIEAKSQQPVGIKVHEALIEAVDALPELYRDVVVLRYVEKLSTDEIASRLSIPAGTVRGRLSRADSMLAVKLKHMKEKGGAK